MSEQYRTPEEMKADITKKIGDLSNVHVMNNQVLCAIYKRPEKTKGGIILTKDVRKEDEYQGKTMLILKLGPIAYTDEDGRWFRGSRPQVGDWIITRASDGWALNINEVPCRMIDDTVTRLIVPSPEMVW